MRTRVSYIRAYVAENPSQPTSYYEDHLRSKLKKSVVVTEQLELDPSNSKDLIRFLVISWVDSGRTKCIRIAR